MTCNNKHVVTSKQHDLIFTIGSTVKKSVSKRRGGRRQQLRELNNDHSIMEDVSPAKKQNAPVHRNTIMKSH